MDKFYKTLSVAGLGILRAKHLVQLQKIEDDAHGLLRELAVRQGATPVHIKSQMGQDLFALFSLNWKRGGYFVEFGATNGMELSNTYLLEKDFEWTGILAEPAKIWHSGLIQNRSAAIDFDCVWKESGNHCHLPSLRVPNSPHLVFMSMVMGTNSLESLLHGRR